MSRAQDPLDAANPFSTRHTRPGSIPYRFASGVSVDLLVERLERNQWWGQILGAHGSGKSALVATLVPAIERAGRQVILVELHDGQRRLPEHWQGEADLSRPTVVIVDGCEQLSPWNRYRLKRFCRCRGLGLIVTAHRPLGLPDLFSTSVDPDLAQEIVRSLLGDAETRIRPEEVRECFDRQQGNLREVLFDLYDLYEQRRPS